MFGSWELCISVQNNTYKFMVCKVVKNKIVVSKAFQLDIPDEFGIVKDPSGTAVTGLIRNALKTNSINLKKYHLCISNRDIITRVIKLPKMELKDLKSFMKQSIQQYFPIKVEDYYFDFKVQSVNIDDEKSYYNLLLVAMPKVLMQYYSEIFLRCGLKPKTINIYSDVLAGLFSKIVSKDIVILEMGYNHSEFVMLEGKNIFINSVLNYSIQKGKVNGDEEEYLKSLGQEQLGEDFLTAYETIGNYINFFSSRHHGKSIEEIYFIGEGAMLTPIWNIEKDFNIKVSTGKELILSNIILQPQVQANEKFYLEKYYSCLGLISGGISK